MRKGANDRPTQASPSDETLVSMRGDYKCASFVVVFVGVLEQRRHPSSASSLALPPILRVGSWITLNDTKDERQWCRRLVNGKSSNLSLNLYSLLVAIFTVVIWDGRTSREVDYIATRRRSVYKDVCVPLFSDLNDGCGSLAKLILNFFLMSTRLCYFNKMLFLFTQYIVSTRTGQGIKTFFIKSVKGWMGHIFNNRNPLLLLSLCWWLQKIRRVPSKKINICTACKCQN